MLEWFEFEEKVGRMWHRWAASSSASYPRYPDAAVTLERLAPALAVFFRLSGGAAGIALSALAARRSGHRLSLRQRLGVDQERLDSARLDDDNLLLPPELALFPQADLNRDLYYWLAALLASVQAPAREFKDPMRRDIVELRQAIAAKQQVLAVFPGLAARYSRLEVALLAARPQRQLPPAEAAIEEVIRHLLGAETPLSDTASRCLAAVQDPALSLRDFRAPPGYRRALPVPLWASYARQDPEGRAGIEDNDELPQAPDAQGEVKHKRKAQRRHQDQAERDDPLVFNRFEKILSLAEMVNVNRAVDDEEDKNARDNAEQMDEITLSKNQQRAASQLKIDLDLAPGAAETQPLAGEFTYPEWSFRAQAHLPEHCRVLAGVSSEEAEGAAMDEQTRQRIRRVRRQFEALRPRREWLRAQLNGSELDMDAVIRAHCDRLAVGQNSECQYMDARPQSRDLAVSILVDVSLSTDAWVEDRRVIDIEKEALLVLAHGLASCGDDYCIHSFTSHRRQRVWVNTLKSYEESMGERVQRRITALKPGSYTRMGAAIRHSAALLQQRPNRHRLLLLLSDGKPSDVDYYEGRYALEDTRRAVLEARQADLRVFAVTIDQDAQSYIGQLFGRGAYAMVRKPEHLARALPGIYQQIVAS